MGKYNVVYLYIQKYSITFSVMEHLNAIAILAISKLQLDRMGLAEMGLTEMVIRQNGNSKKQNRIKLNVD